MNKNNYTVKDALKIKSVSPEKIQETPSIRGHVVIKDDKGNVVVDKDNLVVYNGRWLLARLFFDNLISNNFITKEDEKPDSVIVTTATVVNENLKGLLGATELDETTNNFKAQEGKNKLTDIYNFYGLVMRFGNTSSIPVASDYQVNFPYNDVDKSKNTVVPTQITFNQSDLFFKFEFSITGTSDYAATMNELGLFLRASHNQNTVNQNAENFESDLDDSACMISRIVFDTLSINSSTSYNMEYYLYF